MAAPSPPSRVRGMALPRGACAPLLAASALVEAAVRGAVLGGAPRRTVAAVARSAVSAALFRAAEAPALPADGADGGAPHPPRPGPAGAAAADPRPSAHAAKRRRRRQRRAARKAAEKEEKEKKIVDVEGAAADAGAAGAGLRLVQAAQPSAWADSDGDIDFDDTWADDAVRRAPPCAAGAAAAEPA
eukprot:2763622-Pyramimonas_sp.AAC.1